MKPSKQRIHASGNQIGQAGEGVPVAARIFANYVLLPASGHPHKARSHSALHGAALLVFADQRDQPIHLTARDAAHVASDTMLRTRENVGDELVSIHRKPKNRKDLEMTREVHRSACDALVPQGARVCPGCGLPLTAQAIPAVYVEEPLFPLWGVILVAFVVIFLAVELLSK